MLRKVLNAHSLSALKRFAAAFSTAIDASKLTITRTSTPKQKLPLSELKFGASTTDHLLSVDWDVKEGWHAPEIIPYGPLSLDPTCSVFHYALECFEGMKAYIDDDGDVRLFRPMKNLARMNTSMARLCMPSFDEGEFYKCITEFVNLEKDWIPKKDGYSLYLRPTAISTHPYVGVAAPQSIKMFVVLCPVGPYYSSGFAPVKLLADPSNVRAWPGGTGNVKVGGNYALAMQAAKDAQERGFANSLWLFGDDMQVTEVGTMNQFWLWINKDGEKELITAPLDGTILPGVTRDSVLELCRSWGEFKVTERKYTLPELMEAVEEGRMIEGFGTGTAAIVSCVESFTYEDKEYKIPVNMETGLMKRCFDNIIGIQYGRIPHEWSVKI